MNLKEKNKIFKFKLNRALFFFIISNIFLIFTIQFDSPSIYLIYLGLLLFPISIFFWANFYYWYTVHYLEER